MSQHCHANDEDEDEAQRSVGRKLAIGRRALISAADGLSFLPVAPR